MINIEQRKSINLKSKESLFVSFPYNLKFIERIKSLPKRFYIPATKEWEIPINSINDILNLFQNEEIQIKGKVNTKITNAIEEQIKFDNSRIEYNPKTKPYQHQIESFQYAMNHNKFLLGDEQGLGKTKQAIDIAVARKNKFKHCLIICGVNGLKWNWLKEIEIHSNEKGHIIGSYYNQKNELVIGSMEERLKDLERDISEFFLITNIETLRDEIILNKLSDMCKKGIIGMTIIDEIHKAKNPTSIQGKAIHKLNSYYKLALTGTPLMNNPLDLYNILKWLDIEKHSFYQFKNRYCIMGGYGNYQIVGYKNLKEVRDMLDANMLRRKKEDVLDLPEKIYITEYVEMTAKQELIYKEIKEQLIAEIDKIKTMPNPLAQLIRLRQATGWTGILSSKIKESAKIDRMEELIDEIIENGEKAIIFSNWEEITEIVKERLKKYNPAYITGKIKNRQEEVEKFQNDPNCKVIIGTIGSMGTGLTLTAASNVIFLDSPWNKANKEQAIDRAHRIGTKKSVNVITIVCKDTIDEKIENIIQEKGEISDILVDGKLSEKGKEDLLYYLIG